MQQARLDMKHLVKEPWCMQAKRITISLHLFPLRYLLFLLLPLPFHPPLRPKRELHLVPVPKYLVARHDGLKDGIGIRALQAPGIKLAEIYQQVADLDVLVVDLRRVREGLALAAAAVGGEGAGGLNGVVVGREGLELGGLGEGAAAEATDASDEALAGESAVAEQDEGGAVDLADALPLEGEPLAG